MGLFRNCGSFPKPFDRVIRGGAASLKYLYTRATGRPKLVNLEVTKLCNAGCDFCNYWETRHEVRLSDYSPIIRKINPVIVSLTGGEPMLRKDLTDIIRQVKSCSFYIYVSMITKGDLLTVDKAAEFFHAGLNQLSISLDFLSDKHNESRGIPGLWGHLSKLIPELGRLKMGHVILNTIIMEDNLDEVLDFAFQAKEWGVSVSYSSYSVMKTGNQSHFINGSVDKVRKVVEELLKFKKRYKGVITTSDYYLSKIPYYFEHGGVPDCRAGLNMLTVTPSGHIKRCSEMPIVAHGTEYRPGIFDRTRCTSCWYSCRGETEAPVTLKRAIETLRMGA
ncbi:MAG: radical SAM protein [Candidatus Caldarchaeum sp.]